MSLWGLKKEKKANVILSCNRRRRAASRLREVTLFLSLALVRAVWGPVLGSPVQERHWHTGELQAKVGHISPGISNKVLLHPLVSEDRLLRA